MFRPCSVVWLELIDGTYSEEMGFKKKKKSIQPAEIICRWPDCLEGPKDSKEKGLCLVRKFSNVLGLIQVYKVICILMDFQ